MPLDYPYITTSKEKGLLWLPQRFQAKDKSPFPWGVRNALGLYRGDKIDFRISGKKEVVLAPVSLKTEEIYGLLSAKCRKRPASDEEIQSSLEAYYRRKFK